MELDSSNAVTRRWLNGDGANERWASQTAGGATSWLLTDRLGSVRDVADMAGTLKAAVTYTAFGGIASEVVAGGWSAPDALYAGGWYDRATGLYQLHWRSYDPGSGQWVSEDPIGFEAGDANLRR